MSSSDEPSQYSLPSGTRADASAGLRYRTVIGSCGAHHDPQTLLVQKRAVVLDNVGTLALAQVLDLTLDLVGVVVERYDFDGDNLVGRVVHRFEDLAKGAAVTQPRKAP
jgi:hypothetical protein